MSDPSGAVRARCARMHEEHQRQQPSHLGVLWPREMERPGEPDRLFGQVDSDQRRSLRAGVALVEYQVEGPEDSLQPAPHFVVGG